MEGSPALGKGSMDTIDALIDELTNILGVEHIDPDSSIGELGIDSVRIVELLIACEKIYGDDVDLASLTIDESTSLRSLDRKLRGEITQ